MEITSAEFVISNTDVKKCPTGVFPEYAFIGRSNVGKSSLINMLTARKGLAMTSATLTKAGIWSIFPDTATPDADKKEKTRYVPSSKTTSSNGNR